MSTPDYKPWFMKIRGIPPIVISSNTYMVPSQLNNRLGFINPGLTLYIYSLWLFNIAMENPL